MCYKKRIWFYKLKLVYKITSGLLKKTKPNNKPKPNTKLSIFSASSPPPLRFHHRCYDCEHHRCTATAERRMAITLPQQILLSMYHRLGLNQFIKPDSEQIVKVNNPQNARWLEDGENEREQMIRALT